MATDKEMAFAIGISPESFSKRKADPTKWTEAEKVKLTELYGESEIPKGAWAPKVTIDSQSERLRAQDEMIAEMTSEINQYRRGTKIAWVGVAAIGMVCATLLFIAYRPVIWDYVAHRAYHDEITEARIANLEQRIETLTIALDAAIAVDGKWDKIFDVQDEKIKDIETKMREVSK